MKYDEAVFKLSTLNPNGFDIRDYTTALATIIRCKSSDTPDSEDNSAVLYFSERKNPHVRMVSCENSLESIKNIDPIKYFSYDNVFSDCFGLVYKHWNGPGVTPEYDLPKEYYDFNSFREDILKKESADYFLSNKDMMLIPSYETPELYIWQVFVKEPYESFYVGRMLVGKS